MSIRTDDQEESASWQVRNAFQSHVHPRILWSDADLGELREKAASPGMSALKKEMLARCECYLDPDDADFIDVSLNRTALVGETTGCGHTWQKIPDLLAADLLTDDPRWAELLIQVLRVLTQDESPMNASIFGPQVKSFLENSLFGNGPQRNLATQGGMIPLMLDMLWERLDGGDRRAACDYLDREVVIPYLDYILDEDDRSFRQKLSVNLGWWEFYSWVWSLAAVYDHDNPRHRAGVEATFRRMCHGMHLAADEAGIISDGPGYAAIAIFGWWTAAEILRRMGRYDFWESHQRFRDIMGARLYYQLPGRHGFLDHSDFTRLEGMGAGSMMVMLLHTQRTGDPVFQRSWEALAALTGQVVPAPRPNGPLGSLGYWLWYEPGVTAEAVNESLAERSRNLVAGQFGLHVIRSGWKDDDLHFSFCAAGRAPGTYIHQHTDAGHFSLAALGEIFCAGRGYGHSPGLYHNVMRPNGEDPPLLNPSCNRSQEWRGGHTEIVAHGEYSNYIEADLAWQWQCCWYKRHVMVVRLPGTEPYVILLDNCNYNNDWSVYDWQFQVQDGCSAVLDTDAKCATVQGEKNRLELAWTTLGADEYGKAPTIELFVRKDRHVYADSRPNPKRDALRYDCLTARLSGYCGQMVSVMIPRRDEMAPVGIERFYRANQIGVVLNHGDWIDTVIVNPVSRRLCHQSIDAEATVIVVRRDLQKRLVAVTAAEAFFMKIDGTELLSQTGERCDLYEHRQQ